MDIKSADRGMSVSLSMLSISHPASYIVQNYFLFHQSYTTIIDYFPPPKARYPPAEEKKTPKN